MPTVVRTKSKSPTPQQDDEFLADIATRLSSGTKINAKDFRRLCRLLRERVPAFSQGDRA